MCRKTYCFSMSLEGWKFQVEWRNEGLVSIQPQPDCQSKQSDHVLKHLAFTRGLHMLIRGEAPPRLRNIMALTRLEKLHHSHPQPKCPSAQVPKWLRAQVVWRSHAGVSQIAGGLQQPHQPKVAQQGAASPADSADGATIEARADGELHSQTCPNHHVPGVHHSVFSSI